MIEASASIVLMFRNTIQAKSDFILEIAEILFHYREWHSFCAIKNIIFGSQEREHSVNFLESSATVLATGSMPPNGRAALEFE
jgi:hypothetical protein